MATDSALTSMREAEISVWLGGCSRARLLLHFASLSRSKLLQEPSSPFQGMKVSQFLQLVPHRSNLSVLDIHSQVAARKSRDTNPSWDSISELDWYPWCCLPSLHFYAMQVQNISTQQQPRSADAGNSQAMQVLEPCVRSREDQQLHVSTPRNQTSLMGWHSLTYGAGVSQDKPRWFICSRTLWRLQRREEDSPGMHQSCGLNASTWLSWKVPWWAMSEEG